MLAATAVLFVLLKLICAFAPLIGASRLRLRPKVVTPASTKRPLFGVFAVYHG